MKHRFTLAILALLVGLAFTGCGDNNKSTPITQEQEKSMEEGMKKSEKKKK